MKNHGFTLVEMMVSLAIFSVVAVIAVGALTKVISANKKAQSIMSSVTTLNFALESMSRDLMTGTDYTCSVGSLVPPDSTGNTSRPCSIGADSSGKYIAFLSQETGSSCNLIHAYRFINDLVGMIHLQKAKQSNCSLPISDTDFADIISPSDMSLTDYRLGVLSDDKLNYPYPIVFIHLTGYAGVREKDKTYVDVETAVSSYYMQ